MPRPKGLPKSGGREKGTPNKMTRELRTLIAEALDIAGGVDYLVWAATTRPQAFLALLGKIIPTEIKAQIEDRDVKITVISGIEAGPPAGAVTDAYGPIESDGN